MKSLLVKVALLVLLIIPSFYTLIKPGFFPMQDDLQAFRVQQMYECFKDLQIPCRWVPDPGYQYGYPLFNYYPPSVYYLGGLLHLIGFQIIDAVKILFALGYILSALTMFVFLRSLYKDKIAFIGALLYTYVPYKATEVYVRGAMSEFWALVIFPLLFWSSYQFIKTQKLKYFIWLAVSTSLLLTTHNLMSLIFFPILGIWCLVHIYLEKRWTVLIKILGAGLLGFGLAAFFSLPVIFEGKYVHLESLLGGYFDYRQHFVDLDQLFISNHWGYGSSYLGPNDDLNLSAGQIQVFLAVLGLVLSYLNYKKHKSLSLIYLVVFSVEMLVLFIMHQKSSFIWSFIPILSWLQFPWRFLADSIFLLSFLAATALYFLDSINKKVAIILGVSTVIGCLILYKGFYEPREWYQITDKDKFSGQLWEKQLTISIFDYLPVYSILPPVTKAPDLPEVLEGETQFISYKKGSNYQIGELNVKSETLLRLPLFDFPGMEVTVDGKKITHWHDDCRGQQFCLGLITFKVPVGNHTIKARLTNTPIRNIGNGLTILSLLIMGGLFLKQFKK
ncbi:hypothetical protein A3C32_02275 [Candidatus Daviesbacteria bacterium RIFCSPHIGHO2_02_FULL_41_14]|nr:MAG: hypothetical protein A3C32_02275 [Candidatus Daviesbacteria bacterium RIFCSPHIGHO2_02_FULL_41_14]